MKWSQRLADGNGDAVAFGDNYLVVVVMMMVNIRSETGVYEGIGTSLVYTRGTSTTRFR